ncbi:hypothetical protein L1987_05268 [Smallanthus sonchifolius]|uniref:Uncharacterized protein n=1 Tax=Smallanthus sonchifolius TaxID=185202 RepID=A0ACB9JV47_9ASTR|nr:hypothetical protein L1987_05268 [Smallanthus sonchifolius]
MWLVLLIGWSMACPSNGGSCRNCISNAMRKDCPKCFPMMKCMARCLWSNNNTPKSKCVKQCDCDTGSYPRLSDCKSCLSQCKCICAAY